ncbi:hypothetical protein [Paenibacillus elgii]|uniref:hypothetical protein n=1 Tax=Paenibacillus elgii TaxID=189691 RepID=UPI0030DBDDAB
MKSLKSVFLQKDHMRPFTDFNPAAIGSSCQGSEEMLSQFKRDIDIPLGMDKNLIEICDNSLSYEGALILAAIIELLPMVSDEEINDISELIEDYQKKLKYGLPSRKAITIYELGFSDRVIAQQLTELLGVGRSSKRVTIRQLKNNEETVTKLLADYPTYFQVVLQQYLT